MWLGDWGNQLKGTEEASVLGSFTWSLRNNVRTLKVSGETIENCQNRQQHTPITLLLDFVVNSFLHTRRSMPSDHRAAHSAPCTLARSSRGVPGSAHAKTMPTSPWVRNTRQIQKSRENSIRLLLSCVLTTPTSFKRIWYYQASSLTNISRLILQ